MLVQLSHQIGAGACLFVIRLRLASTSPVAESYLGDSRFKRHRMAVCWRCEQMSGARRGANCATPYHPGSPVCLFGRVDEP